jgi:lactoylglutathione lyase
MHIAHLAIWAKDLENLKTFYERYFGAQAAAKYRNPRKQFESYFLTFASGARLELMHRPDIPSMGRQSAQEFLGYAHLAISVGSKAAVDDLIKRLACDGYLLLDGPRLTGDGYYEGVVLDPEGNRIEITV